MSIEAQGVAIAAGAVASADLNSNQYLGFAAIETSGDAPVTVTVYDNASEAEGIVLEVIQLGEGDADGRHYPRPGRAINHGLWVVIDGDVAGSLFT